MTVPQWSRAAIGAEKGRQQRRSAKSLPRDAGGRRVSIIAGTNGMVGDSPTLLHYRVLAVQALHCHLNFLAAPPFGGGKKPPRGPPPLE